MNASAIVPTINPVIPNELLPLPLEQCPAAQYLNSLRSRRSVAAMGRALRLVLEVATDNEQEITPEIVLRWNWPAWSFVMADTLVRRMLEGGYAPATINLCLSALRGVLKACWRAGLMTAEMYQRAIDIKNISETRLPAGRDLSSGEIGALANACADDDSPAGVRDAAMIGVLYTWGLRRAELTALDLADFDPASGRLVIRGGKRRKDRTAWLQNGALEAVRAWLELRSMEPGPLFAPINKGGKIQTGRGMTAQAVYIMLQKRASEAGVKSFSPHDFRRTVAGDLLDAGVDIATVAGMLGHGSVVTTGRYDRRPEDVKRKAAAKLHYPFHPRRKEPGG